MIPRPIPTVIVVTVIIRRPGILRKNHGRMQIRIEHRVVILRMIHGRMQEIHQRIRIIVAVVIVVILLRL